MDGLWLNRCRHRRWNGLIPWTPPSAMHHHFYTCLILLLLSFRSFFTVPRDDHMCELGTPFSSKICLHFYGFRFIKFTSSVAIHCGFLGVGKETTVSRKSVLCVNSTELDSEVKWNYINEVCHYSDQMKSVYICCSIWKNRLQVLEYKRYLVYCLAHVFINNLKCIPLFE